MTGLALDEKSVFLHAVEIESAEQQAEFFTSACTGDPSLRAAGEGVLRAHEKPDEAENWRNKLEKEKQ